MNRVLDHTALQRILSNFYFFGDKVARSTMYLVLVAGIVIAAELPLLDKPD